MAQARQVEVGFKGGGSVHLRLAEETYNELREALGGSSRWHQLDANDATITLDLAEVVYVRLDTEPGRVGF